MAPPTTADQLRAARAENRLRAERIRGHRLAAAERRAERHRNIQESLSVDWVTPFAELLDLTRRSGDPVIAGPTSAWQRRQGRNWPIYQTEQELNLLRAPARVLVATNPYAQGMIHGLSSYVISTGYTYRPAKRSKHSKIPDGVVSAAQRVVDAILEHNQWHGGEQPALEMELFERSVEDGEFVLCSYYRENGLTDMRPREPECLTQPPGSDTREWSFGIRTPVDDASCHERYYVQYGDTPDQGEEYGPDEVTHYRRNVRRSMKRGITDFTFGAYDAIDLAGKLRVNLGTAAAQQASIVAVRQHTNGTQQDVQAFVDGDIDYDQTEYLTGNQIGVKVRRSGGWEDIPEGLNYVNGPGPQNAEAHLSILQACLRGAVVKWNGFEWLISADASNNNYASSLTAESPFVRRVLAEQRGYREAFKKAVWLAVKHWVQVRGLRDDTTGRVWTWDEIKSELDLLVEAPSPETRNKLEESQRAQIDIGLGTDSRQQFVQRQGRDWDQVEQDNKEYAKENPPPGSGGQPGGGIPDSSGGQPGSPQPQPSDDQKPPQAAGGGGQTDQQPDPVAALTESLLESDAVPDAVTADEYLDLLESGRITLEDRGGLVPKKITVTNSRTGTTYTKTVMVRPQEAAVARPPAKADVKAATHAAGKAVSKGSSINAVRAAIGDPSKADPAALAAHLKNLTRDEIVALNKSVGVKGGRLKADKADRLLDYIKKQTQGAGDGRRQGRGGAGGEPPETGGRVAGAAGRPNASGANQGGGDEGQSARVGIAARVPASLPEVNKRLDRYENLFRSRGQHQVADWMGKLRSHINAVGGEDALKSLMEEKGGPAKAGVAYEGAGDHMDELCSRYLERFGITAVPQSSKEGALPSAVKPDPYIDGGFEPVAPGFKNKLEESKALPGLETSEDISKIVGKPVTHLTPDVMAKMDEKYGAGKWIIKAYGDQAYAGFGIYFPQRSAQIAQDARDTIWTAGEQLAKHGFEFNRDESGKITGIKHAGGEVYDYGTDKFDSTIHGDAREWVDRVLKPGEGKNGIEMPSVADSEKGAALPLDGKEFMAQPAFKAVGVSDADRAAGRTIAPGEARTHIITRNGKAELVPHSTWIKGEHLPVVFENDDTRAQAQAAVDAINALPESERQGQIYAPDIIKSEDGYKVVETNGTNQYGGSGYLEDNPFIIDAYTSHLTGREPAHVQFIRKLLTKRADKRGGTETNPPGKTVKGGASGGGGRGGSVPSHDTGRTKGVDGKKPGIDRTKPENAHTPKALSAALKRHGVGELPEGTGEHGRWHQPAYLSNRHNRDVLSAAKKSGTFVPPEAFAHLGASPNVGGQEHDVHEDAANNRFYKFTKGGHFGQNKDVHEYLERHEIANKLWPELGYKFHGITHDASGNPQVASSMNRVEGTHPENHEVTKWFLDHGWEPIDEGDDPDDRDIELNDKWRDPKTGTVISDTHAKNFIKTAKGLVPIDVDILPGEKGK